MKKTLLFSSRFLLTAALFFCAASVVSCQKEPTADPAPARAAIRLTAEPADMVRTKSETDVAYASRFVEGDAIGLFAVIRSEAETQAYPAASGNYIQNAKFVRQADGSWREEGSKSYYMEQGQVMDLYAYYPYAENADPTALVYDASVAEADFMTARTAGFSERDGEIRLVFRHKLALAEAFVADADKLTDYAVTVQNVRTKAVFSLAAAAQDAEMQSVDAKTASVAMTRCGNAFRAYLPAQEIAEDKALLKVEGNGFAAFDYTHPGKTSLAAGQVRKLLVTPAFANPELLPNCYVVSPGETLYIPVCKAFGVWEKNEVLAGAGTGMLGAMGARVVWEDVRYLLNDGQITVLGQRLEGRYSGAHHAPDLRQCGARAGDRRRDPLELAPLDHRLRSQCSRSAEIEERPDLHGPQPRCDERRIRQYRCVGTPVSVGPQGPGSVSCEMGGHRYAPRVERRGRQGRFLDQGQFGRDPRQPRGFDQRAAGAHQGPRPSLRLVCYREKTGAEPLVRRRRLENRVRSLSPRMAGSRVRFRNLVAVVQLCYCRHPWLNGVIWEDLGYWPRGPVCSNPAARAIWACSATIGRRLPVKT